MSTDWLVQLATSGAATLIGAAATDAWQQAHAGFGRLFGRGDADREALAGRRLDELTTVVERADISERDRLREQLLPAWETRLIDLLEEHPDAADLLRALRDELQAQLPTPQQQWSQTIVASGLGASAYGAQGGNVHVYHYAAQPPVDPVVEKPTS